MSKLYEQYLKLKKENQDELLLFKSGVFYIFIAEDSEKISKLLNLKLTSLNNDITKCGFPMSALNKYIEKLDEQQIKYKIIDANLQEVKKVEEYVNANEAMQITKYINSLDIDRISPIEALNILQTIKNKLGNNEIL